MAEVLEIYHEEFKKNLRKSLPAVHLVADWYRGRGWQVEVLETREAPTHAEWRDYVDKGDLHVYWSWVFPEVNFKIAVKRIGYHFTSAGDWPFKDEFLIGAKHAYDQLEMKPKLYFILNKTMTHAGVVRTSDYDHWYVTRKPDGRYGGHTTDSYAVSLRFVEFIKL